MNGITLDLARGVSKEMSRTLLPGALYVDTSGWLAYLVTDSPEHAIAREALNTSEEIITSAQALLELNHTEMSANENSLASLMWDILGNKNARLIEITSDDERLAWRIFVEHSGAEPSFGDCITLSFLYQHGIRRWLSFSNWLPKTTKGIETYIVDLTS